MPRLLVNPRSSAAWEIELKPGQNLLGRGFANDFKIDDPSVSSSHCQILVDQANVLIKDLGSTNGTFVNRAPVTEAALQPGQTIHLGGVEILFDAPGAETAKPASAVRAPIAVRLASPTPAAHTPAPAIMLQPNAATPPQAPRLSIAGKTSAPPPVDSGATEFVSIPEDPPLAPPVPAMPQPGIAAGPQFCKFHPKSSGRYFCPKCSRYFCEFCVTARGDHRLCRHCGVDCAPVEVQITRPKGPGNFFKRVPG